MRKKIIWLLQLSIIGITLLLIGIFAGPVLLYVQSEPSDLSVSMIGGNIQSSSYNWLKQHYKWTDYSPSQKDATLAPDFVPDMVWIDDSTRLTLDIGAQLKNNRLLGEFLFANEYASPVQREQVEYLFNVKYSGFIGKSVADLSDKAQVPLSIRQQYESLEKRPWDFSGSGLIIFSDSEIRVLSSGQDYQGQLYWTGDGHRQNYFGYFEIVSTSEPVTSQFKLDATELGKRKLDGLNLTPIFPASVESQLALYNAYYFTSAIKDTSIHLPYFYAGAEDLLKRKVLYDRYSAEQIYWQWYVPKLESIVQEALVQKQASISTKPPVSLVSSQFKVEGHQIYKRVTNGSYAPFFIKGVNLGTAVPGKTFTEFPQDISTYRQWLNQMKTLNINTLRVYTLLPPTFYKALYDYNLENTDQPLYLLQEIWPEENPKDHNYLLSDYNDVYKKEIEYAVHAVHGNISIPKRDYRAYGAYAYDISPYLIGYLVGRELEPDEVIATNNLNPGYRFEGQYLYGEPDASPTENWLAASCDYALEIEAQFYGYKGLVSVVNWPTLDPLTHFSETAITPEGLIDTKAPAKGAVGLTYNDKVVVDINHIGIHPDQMPGLFGSYHIYPNYPDFMNNDPEYSNYRDEQGQFRYGGYLQAFMEQHSKYPALVAEYGISTSMITAHMAPDGNNHGGLSEIAQADEIIRMSEAIHREGYAGGLIFEWIDEWTKKTWTTEPYMIPYNRHMLWHNALDPEQNYGLVAYEGLPQPLNTYYNKSDGHLTQIQASTDTTYLNLVLTFDSEQSALKETRIEIDTHTAVGGSKTPEFILRLNSQPELLVNPGYNWTKGKFYTQNVPIEQYEKMTFLTNGEAILKDGTRIPALQISLSSLKTGSFEVNQNQVERKGNTITVRLPYGLLGISDPSSQKVLSDQVVYKLAPLADTLKTLKSTSLNFEAYYEGQFLTGFSHNWTPWDEVEYNSRPKEGFSRLSEYFKTFGQ